MPNCFIIGAAKSGTSTLADVLKQHPQVYLPYAKEPNFFASELMFVKGLDWYRDTFYARAKGRAVRIDASPSYLYLSIKTAERLKAYDRQQIIKIIAILRDPAQRAYSMYWQMVRMNREHRPFAEALAVEEELLRENIDSINSFASHQYGYFRGGCYSTLLKPYLDLFPRDQIHLLLHDDLLDAYESTLLQVYHFLNLEPVMPKEFIRSNPAALPRSRRLHAFLYRPSGLLHKILKPFTHHLPYEWRYRLKRIVIRANLKAIKYPPMPVEVELQLRRRYAGEIHQLEQIMGRDLSHWLAARGG
ncbi:MAG: sulfotransferase domain-containing protein [Anaerolineaceae bacterium]